MITEILKDLIKIDTRTSISNETAAALYLKNICDHFRIACEIIEPVKGKGSIIAHIPGRDQSKAELLLLSHLDTAEFGDLTKWRFQPCAAVEHQGRIFGRGAIDCKGLVSLGISILIHIRKYNLQPERGIVLAAVADEENGGRYGLGHLIENHQLIQNSKYVLGEGGGFPIKLGNTCYYTCQNAEKGRMSFEVADYNLNRSADQETFVGNPLINLFKGLWKTKLYDRELVKVLWRQLLLKDSVRRLNLDALLQHSYYWTKAGEQAILNISSLPGTDARVINGIFKHLGIGNGNVKPVSNIPPTHSPLNTKLYAMIVSETAKMYPQSRVIPYTTPGYSDNRFLRSRGKVVYGYFPLSLKDRLAGIHGYNEAICIDRLLDTYNLISNIVLKFCNAI